MQFVEIKKKNTDFNVNMNFSYISSKSPKDSLICQLDQIANKISKLGSYQSTPENKKLVTEIWNLLSGNKDLVVSDLEAARFRAVFQPYWGSYISSIEQDAALNFLTDYNDNISTLVVEDYFQDVNEFEDINQHEKNLNIAMVGSGPYPETVIKIVSANEIHFGTPHDNEITRPTVVAVIYNLSDRTFLYQYWESYYGLTCLLSGGIEPGESPLVALQREIVEETGFVDFEVKSELGGRIFSHYYQAKKDTYYVKEITAFFVVLNSLEQVESMLEDDEIFKTLFGDVNTIKNLMTRYKNPSGGSVEDHVEILDRGVRYLKIESSY